MGNSGQDAAETSLLREYGVYLRVEKGLRPRSCLAYGTDLRIFAEFAENSGQTSLTATEACLRGFLAHLREHGVDGRTVARKLSCLRGFYRWLLKDGRIGQDPTVNLESPKSWKVLPKHLSTGEVVAMLDRAGALAAVAQSSGSAVGVRLRDHALMELLYAGGLRVGEIVALRVEDLHLDAGSVQVRGKGDKERVVPIGRPSVEALEVYLARGRADLLRRARAAASGGKGTGGGGLRRELFLSPRGNPMSAVSVWKLVKALDRRASPHTLRHSCATHMVEGGADLRTVQTLLGHADIATTQVYTHLAIDHLKAVHRTHHPRSRRGGGLAR